MEKEAFKHTLFSCLVARVEKFAWPGDGDNGRKRKADVESRVRWFQNK